MSHFWSQQNAGTGIQVAILVFLSDRAGPLFALMLKELGDGSSQ
jgi:hypothetical protein